MLFILQKQKYHYHIDHLCTHRAPLLLQTHAQDQGGHKKPIINSDIRVNNPIKIKSPKNNSM